MIIYLDLNIIQEIKKDNGNNLLALLKADKKNNIYCFSEAHLFDLSRDTTNIKYDDMDLLKLIVDENCYFFKESVKFQYISPRDYYDRFDWTDNNRGNNLPPKLDTILQEFKNIPINFTIILESVELPIEVPKKFTDLLHSTTNLFDFSMSLLDYSEEITSQQKSFKELLKYLHKDDLRNLIYQFTSIKGIDGVNILNREEFYKSYSEFCFRNLQYNDIYNFFIKMYYSLDLLGIIKGKPSKQKLSNLINDARHAFFGGYCDLVVSKDEDFIKKSTFLYDAIGIYPRVINYQNFKEWLIFNQKQNNSITLMLDEVLNLRDLTLIEETTHEDTLYKKYKLARCHFSYFNTLIIGFVDGGYFFYFSNEQIRFNIGVLVEQIYILNELLNNDLGIDLQNKGPFSSLEINEGKWSGRAWYFKNYQIELHLHHNGLILTFNPRHL